ncbi:MAG TPA: hypothetical protein VI916_01875 [Acidimicrobiia bacterium]|nr:hypothetical protein [Acidimicrobiia bacterium]
MLAIDRTGQREVRRLVVALFVVAALVGGVALYGALSASRGLERCELAPRSWVSELSNRLDVPLGGGWMVRTRDPDLEGWWFLSADAYLRESGDPVAHGAVATWAVSGVTRDHMRDVESSRDDLANLVNLTFAADDLARVLGSPGTVAPPEFGVMGVDGADLSRACMDAHRP